MLDSDNILEYFDKIENKVETLIEDRNNLEASNNELKANLAQVEAMLQEKIEQEKRQDEVKTLIRSKIDSLMGRLDGITEV